MVDQRITLAVDNNINRNDLINWLKEKRTNTDLESMRNIKNDFSRGYAQGRYDNILDIIKELE
ncbi:MAG: hypothetical protein OCD03_02710 [Hyphomicrobiales bacterium]